VAEGRELSISYYRNLFGVCPFKRWRESIIDFKLKSIIDARITRIRNGNFGKCRSLGEGVFESKIDFGSGPRIYYGQDGETIILLNAGDKSSQDADIKQAIVNWRDYKERK
jgi:putative addiction module killer protein